MATAASKATVSTCATPMTIGMNALEKAQMARKRATSAARIFMLACFLSLQLRNRGTPGFTPHSGEPPPEVDESHAGDAAVGKVTGRHTSAAGTGPR